MLRSKGLDVIGAAPLYSGLFFSGMASFSGRLSTLSGKVTDSGSGHLDALFQVTVAKVPKCDSSTVLCSPLNRYPWSTGQGVSPPCRSRDALVSFHLNHMGIEQQRAGPPRKIRMQLAEGEGIDIL